MCHKQLACDNINVFFFGLNYKLWTNPFHSSIRGIHTVGGVKSVRVCDRFSLSRCVLEWTFVNHWAELTRLNECHRSKHTSPLRWWSWHTHTSPHLRSDRTAGRERLPPLSENSWSETTSPADLWSPSDPTSTPDRKTNPRTSRDISNQIQEINRSIMMAVWSRSAGLCDS